MSAIGNWMTEQRRAFFSNAVSQRDFRTQMRGKKAVLLWLFYLGVFFFVVGFGYQSQVEVHSGNLVELQSSLNSFYQSIIAALGGFIVMATPALTALSVVGEKQRQSLDLVACSPVSFRYLLLGKMIGSFRYVWMLLVLSLPFTAVCVSLGGATWQNVLVSYALLAAHGLVLMSIGILISSVSQTATTAILYSYFCTLAYSVLTFALAADASPLFSFGPRLQDPFEAPVSVALSPFLAASAASTHTTILDYAVPNWILAVGVCLLLADLFLAGAGSALGAYGAKETLRFRTRLLVNAVLVGSFSAAIYAVGSRVGSRSSLTNESNFCFYIAFLCLSPLLANLFAWNWNAPKRFQYDGDFRLRQIFRGTPSGGLPFAILLILVGNFSAMGVGLLVGIPLTATSMGILVFCAGYATLWWGLTQLTSCYAADLKFARVIPFFVVLLCELAVVIAVAMTSDRRTNPLYTFSFISGPVIADHDGFLKYGVAAAVVGIVLRLCSRTPRKERNIETVA